MITSAGGGFSRHDEIAINRWRNDATRDNYGQWCYVRALPDGAVWSAAHQPVCAPPAAYNVTLAVDRATFHRRDGDFETRTDIVVVPGESAESRRVVVSNLSDISAEVELTSYQEIVLAPLIFDRGHRAFGNLFVQTEWLPGSGSILAMRRPRSKQDKPIWGGHTIAAESSTPVSCETDRARFIGRGRTARNPVAMDKPGDLTGVVGAVLDPVFALRTRLSIPARGSAQVVFTTFVADDRVTALRMADAFNDPTRADRGLDLAVSYARGELEEFAITFADAALYQELAGLLLYGVRPAGGLAGHVSEPPATRTDLLAIGVTAEFPILLARVSTSENAAQVGELVKMHRYWNLKGVASDLVILCGTGRNDGQIVDDVLSAVAAAQETSVVDQPRGIFVRRIDSLREKDIVALESIARLRIECGKDFLSALASV